MSSYLLVGVTPNHHAGVARTIRSSGHDHHIIPERWSATHGGWAKLFGCKLFWGADMTMLRRTTTLGNIESESKTGLSIDYSIFQNIFPCVCIYIYIYI